jgi:hypothetical protein
MKVIGFENKDIAKKIQSVLIKINIRSILILSLNIVLVKTL